MNVNALIEHVINAASAYGSTRPPELVWKDPEAVLRELDKAAQELRDFLASDDALLSKLALESLAAEVAHTLASVVPGRAALYIQTPEQIAGRHLRYAASTLKGEE